MKKYQQHIYVLGEVLPTPRSTMTASGLSILLLPDAKSCYYKYY